jgi:hypothetical protein
MTTLNPRYTCAACGRDVAPEQRPCLSCGCERRNVMVSLSGVQAVGLAGSLGLVSDSPSAPDKPHLITVQTPLGACSEAQAEFSPDGIVTLRASGRPDVGTRGEPQVCDILRERLASEGSTVVLLPGAQDSRGEDGLLLVDGRRLALQVTSVPASSDYWHSGAQSSALISVEVPRAVEWLRAAVERKSQVDDRASTILVIDARHAGVLANAGLVNLYVKQYSSPTRELGFAQAWVVGPTPSHCIRL